MKKLKKGASVRNSTQVGTGDYVKVNGRWKKIESNTATGAKRTPKYWDVRTDNGDSHGMFNIQRYAKAEDLE